MGRNGVYSQQVSFAGLGDNEQVSNKVDNSPTDDNKGNSLAEPMYDHKCQVVDDEDIAYYFCD